MTTSKRNRWIKIGIAVSVVWAVGVAIFSAYEHRSLHLALSATVRLPDPSRAGGWEEMGQQTLLTECVLRENEISCSPRWSNLSPLLLAPVIAAWLLIAILICPTGSHTSSPQPGPIEPQEWKAKANAEYQKIIGTIIALATASLILPSFFLKELVALPQRIPLLSHLTTDPASVPRTSD